jgi:hypothetical protein
MLQERLLLRVDPTDPVTLPELEHDAEPRI